MGGFKLQRLGMIMEPEPGNPQEVEGVLNPAAARGPDGKLYPFPRRWRRAPAIDRRDDLGSPDRFDVYYGMADSRIGVARLDVPDFEPTGGVADPPEAMV